MFELIAEYKPLHVMDLPQLPDEPEALENWTMMIHKLKGFLERVFERTTTEDRIEQAIRDSNAKVRIMNQILEYAALDQPLVGWQELYDIFFLAQSAMGSDIAPLLDSALKKLERRRGEGYIYGPVGAPG